MSDFKSIVAVSFLKTSACLPLPLSHAIGACIGQCNYWLDSKMTKVTRENLRLCFPELSEHEREQRVRRSLIETGKSMMETGAVWLRDYAWVRQRIIAVEGLDLLKTCVESERGTILLAPHLGNWEVLGLYLTEVAEITCLYQPPEIEALGEIIRNSREKLGTKVVPTNRKGVLALLKVLKGGGFTGILPDQVPDRSGGNYAPFFGVNALTMTLIHNLVRRTNSHVVAGYAERVKGGYKIVFKSVSSDSQTEGSTEESKVIGCEDEIASLTALNRAVESCVRDIPDQYQWEYKRFKRQPKGEPKFYRFKK
jgi:Kdo2-lipid IVA lauroyltransferase/acyltransferase